MNEPSGIVVVDKPAGPTSHDVVDRIRRAVGTRRVGHAGTLDPPATGVLIVGVGRATRLLNFLQPLPKTYRAGIRFGVTTATGDAGGDVVDERPCGFGRADLEKEAAGFIGEIEQVPPMVAAIKVGGEPLYRAARRGEVLDRPPRKVRIYELVIEDFRQDPPTAVIFARVSAGTYIRSLAADLGERLGCGAHLEWLRRLSVGSFSEDEALSLATIESMGVQSLRPMGAALRDFPSVVVDAEEAVAVSNGRPLPDRAVRAAEIPVVAASRSGERPPHEAGMTAGIPVAVLDPSGNLLAVYRRSRSGLRPAAVLVSGGAEP